ncbi:hypothetical protein 1013_scaffold24_00059 [Bacteriophage sp.]|nr:hypothetical protein 1013_scaffold24_00059 [Bacteriophage sp.]
MSGRSFSDCAPLVFRAFFCGVLVSFCCSETFSLGLFF